MHAFVLFQMAFGLLLAPAQTRPTAATRPVRPATARTHLEIHINPFVDMHYFVRRHISEETSLPDMGGLAEATRIAREFEVTLGSPAAWGLVEDNFIRCETAAEAREICQKLPERRTLRSGTTVAIRQPMVSLLEAYARIEPAFRETVWPRHKAVLEAARSRINEQLIPKQAICFDYILERLGMQDPKLGIPMYLVAEAPYPGGFTHRRRGRGGVCVVGVEHVTGSLLWEVVLHEATHALDIATLDQETAFQRLRAGLREAGYGPDTDLHRDVPHTLLFYQAAETTRRLLDPDHKHYGDAIGYYAKVRQSIQAVRPAWNDYLEGNITRAAALRQILSDVLETPQRHP